MNIPGAVDQGPAAHCLLLHPLGRRADRQNECEISPTLPTDTTSFLNRSDSLEGRRFSPGSWSLPLPGEGDTGAESGVCDIGPGCWWTLWWMEPLQAQPASRWTQEFISHKAFRGERWGLCEYGSQVAQPALLLQISRFFKCFFSATTSHLCVLPTSTARDFIATTLLPYF